MLTDWLFYQFFIRLMINSESLLSWIGYTGITMNDCILLMDICHLLRLKISTIVYYLNQTMLPDSSKPVFDKTRTVRILFLG